MVGHSTDMYKRERAVFCRSLYKGGNGLVQGCPDRGPRAQICAPDRLFLGPLGLKYMH